MASTNEAALRANAEPPHNSPDRSSEMLLQNEQGTQAKLSSFRFARGNAKAVIEISYPTTTRTLTVQFGQVSEARALALCNAIARLEIGGVVMDGESFRAIYDSLDNARGLPSELAPQHEAATLTIAAIERSQRLLSGVVS